jgi:hypothetical protein
LSPRGVSAEFHSEKHARFDHVARDCEFYFPNDHERRYRWIKISPTLARNLVNGNVALVPIATPVFVVPAATSGSTASGGTTSAPSNTLRVRNPNANFAEVSLRSDAQTSDLSVPAYGTAAAELADGTYQVFFSFSDRPGKVFQGDDVSLHGNIAEIQLVSVPDGNYGMREVN